MRQLTRKLIPQNGIALVIVLWMLILLTIMAATYSSTMRTESALTAHQVQTAQSRALAEAGIWFAINDLLKPKIERSWSADGQPKTIEYANGSIRISIQDEAGKIDLNTARAELLQSLLQSTDIAESKTTLLLDAILDWRDRDELRRASGAEDKEYSAAGLDYESKDGPFNSVDELRLVLGMNESLFQAIEPALTIHSHQPGINPDVAPKDTLMAIPEISLSIVDDFLGERRNSEHQGNIPLPGVDNRFFSRTKDRTFTITSEGIYADSKLKLDVIILLKRNAKLPFSVLSWWEAKPTKHLKQETEN